MTGAATAQRRLRAKCKRCDAPLTRCHCSRGNRPSRKPRGGEAIVQRYGMPQSKIRAYRERMERPR